MTRERRTILPNDAVPQVIRNRHPVPGNVAVGQRGHPGCENRNVVPVRIRRDQGIHCERLDLHFELLRRENGVEGVGVTRHRDVQGFAVGARRLSRAAQPRASARAA